MRLAWKTGVGAVLVAVACASPPNETGSVGAQPTSEKASRDAILSVTRDIEQGLKEADTERLTHNYADDAVIMPPNEDATAGKEAIGIRYGDNFEMLSLEEVSLVSKDLQVLGDIAVHMGGFKAHVLSKAGGEPARLEGKFIHVLRRQSDGSWTIWRDIWNLNPWAEGKSCPSSSTCCCKTISKNDCVVADAGACGPDRPIRIVTP